MALINNVNAKEVFSLKELVKYQDASVASLTLASGENVGLTVMAFDEGEKIASHSAPGDAVIQCLEGRGTVTIDGEPFALSEGQAVLMPAGAPHSVQAVTKFKMLLTLIKKN